MKQGFIFTITDKGCFIAFVKKGSIVAESFFKSPDGIDDSEFRGLLTRHYKAPIIVYMDTLNQTFFEETIPPTNFINKNRIIRQLKEEHKNQTNAVLSYRKTKEIYQFSTVQLSNDNALWFNYINHLENPLDSVRSLAIETRHFLRHIVDPAPVLVLTYFDENIGLRQSVFISRQFYLSRLISVKSKPIETGIAEETKNLVDYLKREESWITDKDITITSLGDQKHFGHLDPRIHAHLDAINISQLCKIKETPAHVSFLSCLVHVLSFKKPEATLEFDINKEKEKEEFLYILINALTFGIAGLALLYMLGSVFNFNVNNVPQLKQEIRELEKKNSYITRNYTTSFSQEYRQTIEKIQAEFNKQTSEIKNPLKHINALKRHMADYWDIQKIEWGVHSPKYLEHSILDKMVRHRNHPYFTMDVYLKFKGPRYHANDMFAALLQTPELKQFQLEHKGIQNGLRVLRVTERENK